ncbi:MAG: hypothetical protein AAF480_08690 [Actinomycetota bacterium]
MMDFDYMASVLLDGRAFAESMALDHQEAYDRWPTSAAMAHTMRSAVIGQLEAPDSKMGVVDKYLNAGRVEFTGTGGPDLLLKSRAAIPLEAPLPTSEPWVPDDAVFLLVYEFGPEGLTLATVPALPVMQNGRRRYHLLDTLEERGTWSTEIAADPPVFDQDDDADWLHDWSEEEEDGGDAGEQAS